MIEFSSLNFTCGNIIILFQALTIIFTNAGTILEKFCRQYNQGSIAIYGYIYSFKKSLKLLENKAKGKNTVNRL